MKIVRKNSILCLILFFIAVNSFAQSLIINKDSVSVYSIIYPEFEKILDSFIIHEQKYDYYDTTVIFPMTIDVLKDGITIQLFSGFKRNDSIKITKDYQSRIFVLHKQHLFIATFRTNMVKQNLFKEEKLKQVVYIEKETNEIERNENSLDEIFEEVDDFWPTTWIYLFKDGNFTEQWKSPMIDLRYK